MTSSATAPDLVCGVDLGTTMSKASLFDLADPINPVATAQFPSPTLVPRPGWSEADMIAVRDTCFSAIATVVAQVDASRVGAIGISGTACGAWMVDTAGDPVANAILWNDARAIDVINRWSVDRTLDEIFEISGNVPFPGYSMALLAWLREHEPETLDRAARLLPCKDWVRLCLTGESATEASDASYVPFDVRRREWSESLAAACGVGARDQRLLPGLRDSTHTAPLLPEVADLLGLSPSTRVGMGLTDIVAGTLGAGAASFDCGVTVLGTSAYSTVLLDSPQLTPTGIGLTAAAPWDTWARTMVNTSGGMTLDWVAGLLFGGDVGALVAAAGDADADNGVVLLPYLSGAGVVSPFSSPNAHGVIAGVRSGHRSVDVARAAVEGVAFAVADCYSAFPGAVTEIVAVGGAARSDLLLQTMADSTGRIVHRSQITDPGSRAVALLAARGAGLIDSDNRLRELLGAATPAASFMPGERPPNQRRYCDLVTATRPLWHAWS